ncbi:hypothetical protein GM418_13440 [Maribellus comscasis]|uniref:Lipoprotein n=1 Tax=Maribellus comscasis TaxID=2681766 RepID=A0A6I6JU91_9BACT|nr:hypothetical protein [Maribellus comscasis]QGY44630.1 hypothetical protein GM418_13440 [Maribellus comscasis]
MRNIPFILALSVVLLVVASCTKEETDPSATLSEETLELVSESTTTEALEEEITRSINEAIVYSEKSYSTEQKSAVISDCAGISIKPLRGFPKTITIDFGDGCTGANGFYRSGTIAIVISDTLRTFGTTYSASFADFYIEGFSINGEISFENTSEGEVLSFYEEMDMIFTGTDGVEIEKTKVVERAWIEGADTQDVSDDVFTVSGSAEVNSSAKGYYAYNIIEPMQISYSCDFISEGVIEITTSASDEPVTIDFGDDSVCDWIVFVSQGDVLNRQVDVSN